MTRRNSGITELAEMITLYITYPTVISTILLFLILLFLLPQSYRYSGININYASILYHKDSTFNVNLVIFYYFEYHDQLLED